MTKKLCFFADIEEVRVNNSTFNPQWIPYENVRYTKQIVDNEYCTLHLDRLRRFTVFFEISENPFMEPPFMVFIRSLSKNSVGLLRGNYFTREGDIYSLGGIMYEMATGNQPST
ncbi:hypothetical protein Glove_229g20 [Diversispora epigaea]|uniref:Protein kinase domain-containing protein n=1 Tax=Diversispora epigaea TaxID=1348612 RepID=A0A397ICX2_9GLOM|nr:hypothetical protein Glove_229g20 [Diversispora epigaea]